MTLDLESRPFPDRVIHMLSRLAFRGIYFPQMNRKDWMMILIENRGPILRLISQAVKMKIKPRREEPLIEDPLDGLTR